MTFLLTFAAAPAHATDIVLVHGLPDAKWESVHLDCDGGAAAGESAPHFGPEGTSPAQDPPASKGEGSVRFEAPENDLEGYAAPYANFGDLAALGARVYEAIGATFAVRITVTTDDGDRHLVWKPTLANGGFGNVETQLGGQGATLFTVYDDASTPIGEPTTIEAYQTLERADDPFEVGLVAWGCDAASTVYVDFAHIQVGSSDKVYDFEAEPTALSIDAVPNSITYGQQVTVSTTATVTETGEPIGFTGIQLWAKPSGGEFANTGTLPTSETGQAGLTDTPSVTTTYEWRFPGGGTLGTCDSTNLKVGVRAKVTASLIDSTVRQGDRLKVKGTVTPDKGGATATLWRKTSSGNIKLGQATIQGDGFFRIVSSQVSTSASATWKLFVKVPAEGGNLPGQSPLMNAEIN